MPCKTDISALDQPKAEWVVPANDQILTTSGMNANDLGLDILPDKMEDLQVAFLRDKYCMQVVELEATLSGECKCMFEDDITVLSHVHESILLIDISGLSYPICIWWPHT